LPDGVDWSRNQSPREGDGRLTPVVDETFGAASATCSAASALQDLDAAIENLRVREGAPNAWGIGFVEPASGRSRDAAMQRHPQAVATIAAWAQSNGYGHYPEGADRGRNAGAR
jgi:hypothetical protein